MVFRASDGGSGINAMEFLRLRKTVEVNEDEVERHDEEEDEEKKKGEMEDDGTEQKEQKDEEKDRQTISAPNSGAGTLLQLN